MVTTAIVIRSNSFRGAMLLVILIACCGLCSCSSTRSPTPILTVPIWFSSDHEADVLDMLTSRSGYRVYAKSMMRLYSSEGDFLSIVKDYHGAFGAISLVQSTDGYHVVALEIQKNNAQNPSVHTTAVSSDAAAGVWRVFEDAGWRHWKQYRYIPRDDVVTSEAPLFIKIRRDGVTRFHCVSGAHESTSHSLVDSLTRLIGDEKYYGPYIALTNAHRQ